LSLKIQVRRGTAAEWVSTTVLASGELGFETDTNKFKIGNGVSTWAALPYFTTSVAGVTSVNMSVPTGLTISGNPITSTGTLALTYSVGYSLPTTANQTNWSTAYGWGNHALAGYLTGASSINIGTSNFALNRASGAQTLTGVSIDGNAATATTATTATSATTATTATSANTVLTVSTSTNASYYLTLVDTHNATALSEALYTDAQLSYNPSTNALALGSVSLTTALTVANGGTGASTLTSGSLLTGNGTGAIQTLAFSATAGTFLRSTGTAWAASTQSLTLSGNTTIGSTTNTVALATTGNTSVTLPTTGTLATTANTVASFNGATGAITYGPALVTRTSSGTATAGTVNVFDADNDTLTLVADRTYLFEGVYYVTTAIISSVSTGVSMGFTFSSAPVNITYDFITYPQTAGTALNRVGYVNTASSTLVSASSASAQTVAIKFKGIFRSSATGGTFIPTIASTSPSTVQVTTSSWISVENVGSSTATLLSGAWS